MFGLSGEHVVVMAVLFLLFGGKKLPELGRSLGQGMKSFRDGMSGKFDEVQENSRNHRKLESDEVKES